MSDTSRKMKLLAWIPCLLFGVLLFFVLYAVFQSLSLLAGEASCVAGALASLGAGAAMLGIYALWNRWWNRLGSVSWESDLPMKRFLPDTGKGILTGIVYFTLVAGIMALTGCYRISAGHFNLPLQVKAVCLFFMVAVCEEVIFRGVIFRMIDKQFNAVAAYIVSALLFGAMHLTNPGATWWAGLAIAIEAGILLSAAYKYSGTLWLPVGIHWAWNYIQGNILGFAVSGGDAGESLFTPEISGPDIITGGAFGAEASIIAVIIGAALSVLFILARRRSPGPSPSAR